MFRKKRRAIVKGPVLAVELISTMLWMAWERWREKERARAKATKEQDAAESAVRQQERMQRRQQREAVAAPVAGQGKIPSSSGFLMI